MSMPASITTSNDVPFLAPVTRNEWTLRVSSRNDTAHEPSTMVVHGAELLRVLARLLDDERVEDVVVAPRARELRAHIALAKPGERLTHGDLEVDLQAREARVRGERVILTRRELALLVFLLRNPNRAWSREELLLHVWESESPEKRRTVDIHVRRLRAKLGQGVSSLETLVGVGYRFAIEA